MQELVVNVQDEYSMESSELKNGTDLNNLKTVGVFTSDDLPKPQPRFDAELTEAAWFYCMQRIRAIKGISS